MKNTFLWKSCLDTSLWIRTKFRRIFHQRDWYSRSRILASWNQQRPHVARHVALTPFLAHLISRFLEMYLQLLKFLAVGLILKRLDESWHVEQMLHVSGQWEANFFLEQRSFLATHPHFLVIFHFLNSSGESTHDDVVEHSFISPVAGPSPSLGRHLCDPVLSNDPNSFWHCGSFVLPESIPLKLPNLPSLRLARGVWLVESILNVDAQPTSHPDKLPFFKSVSHLSNSTGLFSLLQLRNEDLHCILQESTIPKHPMILP